MGECKSEAIEGDCGDTLRTSCKRPDVFVEYVGSVILQSVVQTFFPFQLLGCVCEGAEYTETHRNKNYFSTHRTCYAV